MFSCVVFIYSYSQSVETPHRHVRTRLYFTSESHVHTVLNAFKYGKLFEVSYGLNNIIRKTLSRSWDAERLEHSKTLKLCMVDCLAISRI